MILDEGFIGYSNALEFKECLLFEISMKYCINESFIDDVLMGKHYEIFDKVSNFFYTAQSNHIPSNCFDFNKK